MGKLTASLVVDLIDKTGAKTQAIIGNMSKLQRAERDFMLADRGLTLSNRDRALERLMMQKEAALEDRRRRMVAAGISVATAAAVGVAATGVVAGKAVTDWAAVERQLTRIGITADASAEEMRTAFSTLQTATKDVALPIDEGVKALDTLVASGLSLKEAMSFLPSILQTAQASGAATEDIANTAIKTASALQLHSGEMQKAFDIMLAGSKAGQFEARDIAQYIPELANSFASLGYKGEDGLRHLIAILQTLREDTGSASAAATQAQNIFGKIYSGDTAKKFSDFGINLRKEMEAATASGETALHAFTRLSKQALNGDMSKLSLLFTDQEFRLGMQSLINSPERLQAFFDTMNSAEVDGTAFRDVQRVLGDTQSSVDRLKGSFAELWAKVGESVSKPVVPILDGVTKWMDDGAAYAEGLKKMGAEDEGTKKDMRLAFKALYDQAYPGKGPEGYKDPFHKSVEAVGRGQEFDHLASLRRILRNQELYAGGKAQASTGRAHQEFLGVTKGTTPVPQSRPKPETAKESRERVLRSVLNYPSHGSEKIQPEAVLEQRPSVVVDESQRQFEGGSDHPDGSVSVRPGQHVDALDGILQRLERLELLPVVEDRAERAIVTQPTAEPRRGPLDFLFDRSLWFGGQGQSGDPQAVPGQNEVTLFGKPTVVVEPSGVQQVEIVNRGEQASVLPREKPTIVQMLAADRNAHRRDERDDVPRMSVASDGRPDQQHDGRSDERPVTADRSWMMDMIPQPRDAAPAMRGVTGAEQQSAPVPAGDGASLMQQLIDKVDALFSGEAQKEVSISGTPTVISQPSGVQAVTVTNPMPAPVVTVSVTVHAVTNANPSEIGQKVGAEVGARVKAALDGVHADTEYAVG